MSATTVISEPIKLSDCGTGKVFTINRYHSDGSGQSWTVKVPPLPEGHDWKKEEELTNSILFNARCKKCGQSAHLYATKWVYAKPLLTDCYEFRMNEALE